ncbi:MAG: hypothetical protein ACRCSO_08500 [Sphingomonas sp.]
MKTVRIAKGGKTVMRSVNLIDLMHRRYGSKNGRVTGACEGSLTRLVAFRSIPSRAKQPAAGGRVLPEGRQNRAERRVNRIAQPRFD